MYNIGFHMTSLYVYKINFDHFQPSLSSFVLLPLSVNTFLIPTHSFLLSFHFKGQKQPNKFGIYVYTHILVLCQLWSEKLFFAMSVTYCRDSHLVDVLAIGEDNLKMGYPYHPIHS